MTTEFWTPPVGQPRWRQVPAVADRLEWRGRVYDLSNTLDVQQLASELTDFDYAADVDNYVETQLADALVRETDAEERARVAQESIARSERMTHVFQTASQITGMDRAQTRHAQLTQPSQHPEMLAHFRENYDRRQPPATPAAPAPAEPPQLDARTTLIRDHRRRSGI